MFLSTGLAPVGGPSFFCWHPEKVSNLPVMFPTVSSSLDMMLLQLSGYVGALLPPEI